MSVREDKKKQNQGGKYHGNGSKEQHVGGQHSEYLEQEFQCTFQESGEGLLGDADQRSGG
jgi:hypothetical protein